MRTTLLVVLALSMLAACASKTACPPASAPGASGQTFPAAVAMICDVDRLAGLSADADPLAVGTQRSSWLSARVDNPDGIEFATYLSVKGATDQAKMLREKAKEVGLARCAIADSMEQTGMGGISP